MSRVWRCLPDLCRKLGIAEATLYRWKKQYGVLELGEIRDDHGSIEDERRHPDIKAGVPWPAVVTRACSHYG